MSNSKGTGDLPGMGRTVFMIITHPRLLYRGLCCNYVILKKFFFFQFKSALFPGAVPVSRAEHVLDEHIPFNPRFIGIYLDFVAFWIRIAGFLAFRRGKHGRRMAEDFIASITELYHFAFMVYHKHLSTTRRPGCNGTFRFRIIHLFDPHLMCIPSLHVMLVVHAWTKLRAALRAGGDEESFKALEKKVFAGALVITEAVLYVKQHSINCIAAALYAMHCFDPSLFNSADAEAFVYSLFDTSADHVPAEYAPHYGGVLVKDEDIPWLREHILGIYRCFVEQRQSEGSWTGPLLDFLKSLPAEKT